MENLLEVKGLTKKYKEFTLDNVSISLPKGRIMGLIGPNGAGKTTTIKMMMNMLKKTSGDIKIFGLDYRHAEKEIKNRVGYVGEEQYFYQNKTVKWTGKFVSHFFDNWDQGKFENFLTEFDLSKNKKVKELSRGMKVKLSFAVALSHQPELLIMDEPTSGLDPVIRREILDLLLKLSEQEDLTIFLSSHITDDIARISDFITYMVRGKIVITEVKDDLLSRWKKIHFKKGSLANDITGGFHNIEQHMFGSCGITDRYPEIEPSLRDMINQGDVKVENVNLDDILITLVKEK